MIDRRAASGGLRGELRLAEPMSRHVSWRAGGVAERAYLPADLDDLCVFLRSIDPEEPVHFVGLGSNLLVRDGGLRGTVVFTHWALRNIALGAMSDAEGEIYVDAGVASPKVARFAALKDLVNAEFLAGIPGTIGGALAMNAGCYGGEMWNIVRKVVTLYHAGELRERTPTHYRISKRREAMSSDREHSSCFRTEPPRGSRGMVRICRAGVAARRRPPIARQGESALVAADSKPAAG
jgi:UDP-N-acetylmuramate dehydrogenase